jgi:MFS family permease
MQRHQSARDETASLLRNWTFRRLWLAQFFTITVVYGLGLAGAVLVEELTHSSTQTGLVILSSILPAFLASLVAGAVVDRWGRVQSLIGSYVARIAIALAFWLGTRLLPSGPALALVYAVNVAGAVFAQFALSAELALLPDLVGQERLTAANALVQLGMLIAEGLGIVAMTPLVIKLAGAPTVGLVGAGLSLLGLTLVLPLPRDRPAPSPSEAEEGQSVWMALGTDMQAGWRTIARDRLLSLVAIQATFAATLLLVLLSLVPGLVSRHLGLSVEDAPFLILPGGIGFVLGSALLSRWDKRLSRQVWIAMGLTLLGLGVGLLSVFSGQAGRLGLIVPSILGVGLALALVIIPSRTVLQERPPAQLRGRVISAQLALANAAAVLPLLLGGVLADYLGIRPVMGLLGLLAVGAGAIGMHHRWH